MSSTDWSDNKLNASDLDTLLKLQGEAIDLALENFFSNPQLAEAKLTDAQTWNARLREIVKEGPLAPVDLEIKNSRETRIMDAVVSAHFKSKGKTGIVQSEISEVTGIAVSHLSQICRSLVNRGLLRFEIRPDGGATGRPGGTPRTYFPTDAYLAASASVDSRAKVKKQA